MIEHVVDAATFTPRVTDVPMAIPEPRPGASESIFDTRAAMPEALQA